MAGQAGLRYEVVGADRLRVTLPSPLSPTDDVTMPELVTRIDPVSVYFTVMIEFRLAEADRNQDNSPA